MDRKYLSPEDVCEVIPGMSVALLKQMRFRGDGPRFIKPSPRKVVYAADEVDRWLQSKEVTRTDDPIPA